MSPFKLLPLRCVYLCRFPIAGSPLFRSPLRRSWPHYVPQSTLVTTICSLTSKHTEATRGGTVSKFHSARGTRDKGRREGRSLCPNLDCDLGLDLDPYCLLTLIPGICRADTAACSSHRRRIATSHKQAHSPQLHHPRALDTARSRCTIGRIVQILCFRRDRAVGSE